MADLEHVTTTFLIHGTVAHEVINGHVTADIADDHRGGAVRVYDRKGRIVRVVGYARMERFEWRVK